MAEANSNWENHDLQLRLLATILHQHLCVFTIAALIINPRQLNILPGQLFLHTCCASFCRVWHISAHDQVFGNLSMICSLKKKTYDRMLLRHEDWMMHHNSQLFGLLFPFHQNVCITRGNLFRYESHLHYILKIFKKVNSKKVWDR